jgi:hypothetical protein
MKCLEKETLVGYVYRLLDEGAASQVRSHLAECPRCHSVVEQYGRLDGVLSEWQAATPTPGFDARVRQAVESQQANRSAWAFWGLDWTRGLALASLVALLIAGAAWFIRDYRREAASTIAARHGVAVRPQVPNQVARARSGNVPAHATVRPESTAPEVRSSAAYANDDNDTQALEDYDLAANFDLLSEIPKGEPRVAN